MSRSFFVALVVAVSFSIMQVHAQTAPPILPAPPPESDLVAAPPGEPIETDTSPLQFRTKTAPGSCASDAERLCKGKQVGKGWLKCMGDNEAKLSAGCLREVDLLAKNWRQTYPNWVIVRAECQTVTDTVCKEAAQSKSKKRMLACFKQNEAKLPKTCKYWVDEYVRRRALWK